MSETKTEATGLSVETKIATNPSTSIYMGEPGDKQKATSDTDAATRVQFDDGKVKATTGLGDEDLEDPDEADLEDASEEDGGEEGEGDGEGEALGEFKADDPESVAAYEATYYNEDGTLNTEKLSAEFWNNAGKGDARGELNGGTYAYLEHRLGISKDAVKDIEAALVARVDAEANKLFERVGPKADIEAAIAWGKGGGYTEAQRSRFNAAMQSSDPEVQEEALTALMARFSKSGEKKTEEPTPQAKPKRSVTGSAGSSGGEGYASETDYRKAFREASALKDPSKRSAAISETRARLRRSTWYGKG